ncbi:hypothetical protein JCGZ_13579 [Jatropha curcas]|uniref:Uncharacterized protein n=1 Tax=Jatropha curcas TaxID=180498 RepID=A0A067KLE3_JATCU|nr:hypothetical protein JCGZ_13579 [Jatropha curcas]
MRESAEFIGLDCPLADIGDVNADTGGGISESPCWYRMASSWSSFEAQTTSDRADSHVIGTVVEFPRA